MSEYIIEGRGLTMEFNGFAAVKNVDLKIRRNSTHALIGPNGAGKTTCFNLMTKFLTPTRGSIHFDGTDVTHAKPAEVARMGMVRSFQISATFPGLTVLQNVRIALQQHAKMAHKFWCSDRIVDVCDDRANALLEEVDLAHLAHLPASDLSYGRKRALEIATTLALDPKVLLLDEPTSGMGREDITRTADLIARVAETRTVLMVEHNLSVVADLSDRITVLARGEILTEGSYAEVSRDKRVIEVYMGKGASHD